MKNFSVYKYSALAALISLFLINNYANAQNTAPSIPASPAQNRPAMSANDNAAKVNNQMGQGREDRQKARDERMHQMQKRIDKRMQEKQEIEGSKMEKIAK